MLLAAAALMLLLAGCGGSSSTSAGGGEAATTATMTESTASEAQAEPVRAVGPGAVVLRWWRQVQVNDPAAARRLYAEEPALADLAGQFNYVAGQLDGSVAIAAVDRRGDAAAVRVRWSSQDGDVRTEALGLERVGGEWKLADVSFLDLIVQQLRKAEAG